MGPAVEYVIVVSFDIIQNRAIEFSCGGNGETTIGIKHGDPRPGFRVQPPIPFDLKAHKGLPPVRNITGRQIAFIQAKIGQLLLGKIDPSGSPILTDISQDIRQL
jgi:hypothetical protein